MQLASGSSARAAGHAARLPDVSHLLVRTTATNSQLVMWDTDFTDRYKQPDLTPSWLKTLRRSALALSAKSAQLLRLLAMAGK
jgi:hypothetical protein